MCGFNRELVLRKNSNFLSRGEFFRVSDGPFFGGKKRKKRDEKFSALFSSSSILERYLRTKVCADYDTEREFERV